MAKSIPQNLLNHYKTSNILTLATITKLTLRDGTVMGFTTFNRDIILEEEHSVIYKSNNGLNYTAMRTTADYQVDNLDVEGYLDNESITEADLKAGRYDNAKIMIAELNWADKPYSNTKLNIKRVGTLGNVQIINGQFTAEVHGLMKSFSNNVGSLYQATCRATFGDSKCKVDLTNYTFNTQVNAVTDNRAINCSLSNVDGYFDNGWIEFTSGLNTGLKYEIKSYVSGLITLQLKANFLISAGDTFKAIKGCPKTIERCQDDFGNAVNFRGEPFIPLTSQLINN